MDLPAGLRGGSGAEGHRLSSGAGPNGRAKAALEQHLAGKWRDLFGASFDVAAYDLTSTYFEGNAEEVEKAARGYSRESSA